MQIEDFITVSVVDVKGKPALCNMFYTNDILTGFDWSTVRVFKTGHLTADQVGQDWRARVVNIRPIDYKRKTKDGRVYVYIDVEMRTPIIRQEYVKSGCTIMLKTCCGRTVTRKEVPTDKVYTGWFRLNDESAAKGTIWYWKDCAVCHEYHWGSTDRQGFIEQEREGLEDLLSPQSVNARFNRLPTSIGQRIAVDF